MHFNVVTAFFWFLAHKGELFSAWMALIASASVIVWSLERLVAILCGLFPQLKPVDGELRGIAAWLDKWAKSKVINAVALNRTLKAFALVVLVSAISLPMTAHASGIDWSAGPTLPMLEYNWANPHPVSVAPGAGVQLSITHDVLKRELLGKSWDLLDLQLAAFGSVVSSSSGQQFGALSASVGLCTASSLLCVGVGKHLLAADQSYTRGGYFMTLALSFNFALAPTAPPVGIESGAAGLPRANTLYLGAL